MLAIRQAFISYGFFGLKIVNDLIYDFIAHHNFC